MLRSGMGQFNTKWLKKAGEMTDPCGFPDHFSGKAMGVLRFLHGI